MPGKFGSVCFRAVVWAVECVRSCKPLRAEQPPTRCLEGTGTGRGWSGSDAICLLPAVHSWQRAGDRGSVAPGHRRGLKKSQGPPFPQHGPVFFLVMSGEICPGCGHLFPVPLVCHSVGAILIGVDASKDAQLVEELLQSEEQPQAPVQAGAELLESSSAERDWECWGTTG